MSAVITSRTAAADRVSLGAVLLERNVWLCFALGLGTGFPVASYWMYVFPDVNHDIDKALLLAFTSFGVGAWLALIAAPFFDRYRAPLLGALGHRRSWVAFILATGLVVFTLHLGTASASEVASMRFAAISGVLALLVWALLWISVDALRIDLYRGRSQAAAFTAQMFGSLAAWAIGTLPIRDWYFLAPAILGALMFALALGAVLLIKEPPPITGADETRRPSFLGTLTWPWSAFFARHRRASGFLLAAIACYALAASAADFLGSNGYAVDLLKATRWEDIDFENMRASRAVGTQAITLSAIGAAAGLLIAFKLVPARAFSVLVYANLMLLVFFALCKAWLGFTVFTVAGLYALRTLIFGAAYVIYATVAARLTTRPYTAGQYALLALFVGFFWISETGFIALGPLIGSYALSAAAAVAGIAAIALMRTASRAAKHAPAIDRA